MTTINDGVECELYLVGQDVDDALSRTPFESEGEAENWRDSDDPQEDRSNMRIYSIIAYLAPATIREV